MHKGNSYTWVQMISVKYFVSLLLSLAFRIYCNLFSSLRFSGIRELVQSIVAKFNNADCHTFNKNDKSENEFRSYVASLFIMQL